MIPSSAYCTALSKNLDSALVRRSRATYLSRGITLLLEGLHDNNCSHLIRDDLLQLQTFRSLSRLIRRQLRDGSRRFYDSNNHVNGRRYCSSHGFEDKDLLEADDFNGLN